MGYHINNFEKLNMTWLTFSLTFNFHNKFLPSLAAMATNWSRIRKLEVPNVAIQNDE